MRISTPLDNNMLPDRYGKYAPDDARIEGQPTCSFPIDIAEVPAGAASIALAFLDWDAIPVGGFCWIHWIAANIAPDCAHIPENASQSGEIPLVQGANSNWSPFLDRTDDPRLIHRYTGPCPPDKDHTYTLYAFALDCELDLDEGFYLSEMRRAMQGHVIEMAQLDIVSRA